MKTLHLLCGLLLFVFLYGSANAQSPYFEKFYDTGVDDAGISLNAFSDGRMIVVGNRRRGSGSSTNQGFYMTISANGTEEDIFYQDTPLRNGIGRVLPLPNNRTLLNGYITAPNTGTYDDWVYRIVNENGGVISSRSYGALNLDEEPEQVIRLQDGRFLATGGEGRNNNGYLMLFDENMDVVWRQAFSAPGTRFNRLTAVTEIPGGFIVSGHFSTPTSSPVWETFVARYDAGGSLVWSNKYTQPGMRHQVRNHIVPAEDGVLVFDEFVIGAEQSLTIMKLNYNGEVLSYTALQEFSGNDFLRDAIRLQNGNILLCGFTQNDDRPTRGFLTEITEEGTVVWARTYGDDEDVSFFDAVERSDGIPGFYAVGRSRNCDSDNDDIYLLALDENGEGAGECASRPWMPASESIPVDISSYGQSQANSVPDGLTAPMTPGSVISTESGCVELFVDPDRSSGGSSPFNFVGQVDCTIDFAPIVDADASFSPITNRVDSIVIRLITGANPLIDWLFYTGTETTFIRGQNTASLTIINDGTLRPDQLSALLREVVLRNPTENSGLRLIEMRAYAGCEESTLATAFFNAFGTAVLMTNLPDTIAVCAGEPGLADASTAGATTYRWSNGDTTSTAELSAVGEYFVTVSNSCNSVVDTVVVTSTTTDLRIPDDRMLNVCFGDSAVIDLTVSGADAYTIDGLAVGDEVAFRSAGTFTLVAANACDSVRSSIRITTEDCCQIYLPNAFSPNGDGINDVFRAFPDTDKCSLISDYTLRIYDRWGGEVYAGQDVTQGWDGKSKDEPAANGYYVYTFSYFNGLTTLAGSGDVMLLR